MYIQDLTNINASPSVGDRQRDCMITDKFLPSKAKLKLPFSMCKRNVGALTLFKQSSFTNWSHV